MVKINMAKKVASAKQKAQRSKFKKCTAPSKKLAKAGKGTYKENISKCLKKKEKKD